MILGEVTMLAKHYKCDQCAYDWYSLAKRLPDCCPNRECRSREWNGVKIKRKPERGPAIQLPKPKRIKGEDEDYEF